jgi:hypothetical protein
MRTKFFRLNLLTLLAALGLCTAHAQEFNLVPFNQVWRYLQDTNDLGTAWRATNYNDSAWLEGGATFGFPANEALPFGAQPIQTSLVLSNGPTFIRTSYFRTHFSFPSNPPPYLVLVASNLLDDGAVFYINGTEVGRVAVAAGTVTWQTQASRADDISNAGRGYDVTNLVIMPLRNGDNVLAVEVHQGGATTSSDKIFGMSLTAVLPSPIMITSQPTNEMVQPGQRATFNVAITGTFVQYQWFANNVAIAGATSPSYQTPAATLDMDQTVYHVVVSNALGSVRSSNAVLTVQESGPRLLTATINTTIVNTNAIDVFFDEGIRTNPATWFQLSEIRTTNTITITRIQMSGSQLRVTHAEPLDPAKSYVFTINDLTDTAGNSIAPYSQIAISTRRTNEVCGFGDAWRLFATFSDCLPANWTTPSYTNDTPDMGWGEGPGIFAFEPSTPWNPCHSVGTALPSGYVTYYFRKRFVLSTNLGPNVTVRLRHILDDAAIFYLNGVEFFRTGTWPAGPVLCTTRPTSTVGDAACSQPVQIAIDGGLLGRTNLLAVELHDGALAGGDLDVVFGAELDFEYLLTPNVPTSPPPTIKIERQVASMANLSWTGNGYSLEQASTIPTKPSLWTPVPNMSTNMTVSTSQPARFYRLRKVN